MAKARTVEPLSPSDRSPQRIADSRAASVPASTDTASSIQATRNESLQKNSEAPRRPATTAATGCKQQVPHRDLSASIHLVRLQEAARVIRFDQSSDDARARDGRRMPDLRSRRDRA